MTYNELVDPYLKSIGLKRSKEARSVEFIFPYIIMDVQLQYFTKYIATLDCRHKLVAIRNEWRKAYNDFNRPFFAAYADNDDVQDMIISLMDSFTSYIEKDMTIAKIAVMNVMMDAGYDERAQEVEAACYVCDALAKAAQVQYGIIFKKKTSRDAPIVVNDGYIFRPIPGPLRPKEDPLLDRISHCSIDFASKYVGKRIPVTEQRKKMIEDSFEVLIKKTVRWVFKEAPKCIKLEDFQYAYTDKNGKGEA